MKKTIKKTFGLHDIKRIEGDVLRFVVGGTWDPTQKKQILGKPTTNG